MQLHERKQALVVYLVTNGNADIQRITSYSVSCVKI